MQISEGLARSTRLTAVALCIFAGGCAPMNRHFSDLHSGMPRQQVIELLGKPVSAAGTTGQETLFFRLASSFLDTDGSDTREYYVVLREGVVTEYGERNDEQTRARAQRQLEDARARFAAVSKNLQAVQQQSAAAWQEQQREASRNYMESVRILSQPLNFPVGDSRLFPNSNPNRPAFQGDEILLPTKQQFQNSVPTGRVKYSSDGVAWKEYRSLDGVSIWVADR